MSCWANHLTGESEIEISIDSLSSLYDELSAFKSGLLVWENVAGEGEPKHMKDISKEKVISLWKKTGSR